MLLVNLQTLAGLEGDAGHVGGHVQRGRVPKLPTHGCPLPLGGRDVPGGRRHGVALVSTNPQHHYAPVGELQTGSHANQTFGMQGAALRSLSEWGLRLYYWQVLPALPWTSLEICNAPLTSNAGHEQLSLLNTETSRLANSRLLDGTQNMLDYNDIFKDAQEGLLCCMIEKPNPTLVAESASTTRPVVTAAQLMVDGPDSCHTASAPGCSWSRASSAPSAPSSTALRTRATWGVTPMQPGGKAEMGL